MPTGTPYSGRVPPYSEIRVDAFTTPLGEEEAVTHLHLLTHVHSDHIVGLENPSFGQPVVCSVESKNMLLKAEKGPDRIAYDRGLIPHVVRPWAHLQTKARDGRGISRDLLRTIPLNSPERFLLTGDEQVTVTAIDANHCPGAVMYLIEGSKGAILHTGDFRAEQKFLDEIKQNPFLAPYLTVDSGLDFRHLSDSSPAKAIQPVLEAIYLDTSCLLGTVDIPSKRAATSGLVKLMSKYPRTTQFFINAWTWGYEDVLKEIAKAFGAKIHVDRYKTVIYSSLQCDPMLRSVVTLDSSSTRFHACERFNRCDKVPSHDADVVYVNAVECPLTTWHAWYASTKEKLTKGEFIRSLIVPLARHSSLPELQRFVSLFRPKRVVPNTVLPQYHGADWACIPVAFDRCMSPGGAERVKEDMKANGYAVWTSMLDKRRQAIVDDLESQAWSSEALEFDRGFAPTSLQNVELPDGVGLDAFGSPSVSHDNRRVRAIEQLECFLKGGSHTEGPNHCDSLTSSGASSSRREEIVQPHYLKSSSSAQLEGTANCAHVPLGQRSSDSPFGALSLRQNGSRGSATNSSGPSQNIRRPSEAEVAIPRRLSGKKRRPHGNETPTSPRDHPEPSAPAGRDTLHHRISSPSAVKPPAADTSDAAFRFSSESSRERARDLYIEEDAPSNTRPNTPDPLRPISNEVSPRTRSPSWSRGGGSQNSFDEVLHVQPRTRDRSFQSFSEGVSQGAISTTTSIASVATSIFPSNKLSRSNTSVNLSFVSSATSTGLKPTKRSSDPVILASQKRQRTRLKELLSKCGEAEMQIGISSHVSHASLGSSSFRVSNKGVDNPLGTQGQTHTGIPMLPINDESPGSTNVRLIGENMERFQNGEYLEIRCIDSQ